MKHAIFSALFFTASVVTFTAHATEHTSDKEAVFIPWTWDDADTGASQAAVTASAENRQ